MTKSTITRERLREIAEDGFLKHGESKELARMALAAMDSEPVAWRYRYHDGLAPSNWRYVESKSECITAPNYQMQALYLHANPAPVMDERKSFESFMAERFGDSVDRRRAKNGDQGYMAWDMVVAWIVWQARAMLQAGNSPVVPDGYVMVPKVPSQAHLNSIAMRYRHDFYLLNDAQKDSALATARQMYEECSGQGFYTLPAAPQEVK